MSGDKRKEAKRLCLEEGLTQAAAAQRLGVASRTVERWAAQDGWGAQKKAQKVVSIGEAKRAKPSEQAKHQNPPSIRRRQLGEEIDETEIVEGAITSLSLLLGGMGAGYNDRPIDTRGIGGVAGALCKLLEYRRKHLRPATAAEVAEMAIALGIPPQEFVAELKRQWQLRA